MSSNMLWVADGANSSSLASGLGGDGGVGGVWNWLIAWSPFVPEGLPRGLAHTLPFFVCCIHRPFIAGVSLPPRLRGGTDKETNAYTYTGEGSGPGDVHI
jgi:hypothetical protein